MLRSEKQQQLKNIVEVVEKDYRKKLRGNKNKIFAVNLVAPLQREVSTLVNFVTTQTGVDFACKKGCTYCCSARVEALPAEIFLLASKLKAWPQARLEDLITQLREHAEKAAGRKSEEFILTITCPLLKDGACSVYEHRPMVCRRCNSYEVEACEKGQAETAQSEEVVLKTGAMIYGLQAAYQSSKLSATPHELGQALLLALTDPTALDRWMKGDVVFDVLPEMQ
jgi:uncharacterized protein